MVIAALFTISCEKYLDKKVLDTQYIPETLEDLQALLDNNTVVNGRAPILSELVADNFYVNDASFNAQLAIASGLPFSQNYIWEMEATPVNASWNSVYQGPIYYANIVLDHIDAVNTLGSSQYSVVKGSALFFRAFGFYSLSQLYCLPYRETSASSDPGIVLRMTSNISEPSERTSVKDTYDRIISDLLEAVELLPTESQYPTRPNKAAAYGLLARTYLSMRDYEKAGTYAQLCLDNTTKSLLDYNTMVPIQTPINRTFNQEVIYHSFVSPSSLLTATHAKIDTLLYRSYDSHDLRKVVFFRTNTGANAGTYAFQGSYDSNGLSIFNGLTVGEILLIKSECLARAGSIIDALTTLNFLMRHRWDNTVAYPDITAANASDALNKILVERRKELVFRGLRWSDLRRLNEEGANITLRRFINDIEYSLPPNDPRWLMLIPQDVISRSSIEQNGR